MNPRIVLYAYGIGPAHKGFTRDESIHARRWRDCLYCLPRSSFESRCCETADAQANFALA